MTRKDTLCDICTARKWHCGRNWWICEHDKKEHRKVQFHENCDHFSPGEDPIPDYLKDPSREYIVTLKELAIIVAKYCGYPMTWPDGTYVVSPNSYDRSAPIELHEVVRCERCELFDTKKCKSQWPFRLDGYCAWGKLRKDGE